MGWTGACVVLLVDGNATSRVSRGFAHACSLELRGLLIVCFTRCLFLLQYTIGLLGSTYSVLSYKLICYLSY